MSVASGPMVRHVAMETAALGDLADQLQRMGSRLATAAQECKATVNGLLGGAGADAFAGDLASAVAGAAAALNTQMGGCADAANLANTASRVCLGAILAAAEVVDRSGSSWDTLINIATGLDVAAAMDSGFVFNLDGLLAGLADAILAAVLPTWAGETHAATMECVRSLHGIAETMVDPGPLGPPRPVPVPPTPITPVPPTPGPTPTTGGTISGIADQLSGYLFQESKGGPYLGIDMNRLRHDHPDWANIVQATLNRDKYDWGTNDVQCVAFVDMVLAIANNNPMAVAHVGNAVTYWGSSDFSPPRWAQIQNGHGMPQPGDIMVLGDHSYGHVAIITRIDTSTNPHRIWFANANSDRQEEYFTIAPDGTVSSTWRGYGVLGFIRQTG